MLNSSSHDQRLICLYLMLFSQGDQRFFFQLKQLEMSSRKPTFSSTVIETSLLTSNNAMSIPRRRHSVSSLRLHLSILARRRHYHRSSASFQNVVRPSVQHRVLALHQSPSYPVLSPAFHQQQQRASVRCKACYSPPTSP